MSAPSRRALAGLVLLVLAVGGAAEAWRAHVEAGLGRELARLAAPGDLHLVSSETCLFCERARRWLTLHQVRFSECFIERDAACAAQYRALGAAGTPTVLVRGQPQLGFSPQRVRDRLADRAG